MLAQGGPSTFQQSPCSFHREAALSRQRVDVQEPVGAEHSTGCQHFDVYLIRPCIVADDLNAQLVSELPGVSLTHLFFLVSFQRFRIAAFLDPLPMG
jgi:hypothetical protein